MATTRQIREAISGQVRVATGSPAIHALSPFAVPSSMLPAAVVFLKEHASESVSTGGSTEDTRVYALELYVDATDHESGMDEVEGLVEAVVASFRDDAELGGLLGPGDGFAVLRDSGPPEWKPPSDKEPLAFIYKTFEVSVGTGEEQS